MSIHSVRALSIPFLFALAGCSSTSTPGPGITTGTDAGESADTGTTVADSGTVATGGTAFTGTLGALGKAQPTVSSLVISNSGETLIYMSSGPMSCDQIKTSRWLGSMTPGSQVIEIVVQGAPKIGVTNVPPGEVNYAPGGKSSSYEVNAAGGSITFTKYAASGVVEGSVNANYDDGSTLAGTFHAEFCAGGQGY